MNLLTSYWQKFKSLRLVSKLIIGYAVMIVVPFSIFSILFYQEMNNNLLSQFLGSKEKFIEQASNSLQADLTKIESVYPLFQNNTSLTEYLNGAYRSDWEIVYNYKKEILPIFSFTYLGNKGIDMIHIYKKNTEVLSLNQDIVDEDKLPATVDKQRLQKLKPEEGLWVLEQNKDSAVPGLRYYRKLYTDTYSKELGYLELVLNGEGLRQFMSLITNSSADSSIMFVNEGNQIVYSKIDTGLTKQKLGSIVKKIAAGDANSFYMDGNSQLVTSTVLDKLNLRAVEISDSRQQFPTWRKKELLFLSVCGILLAVLSALYYVIVYSITKRILHLSRHMKKVGFKNLSMYTGKTGPDEIGFLISSYNSMIARIDELTYTVHKVELMKKEADFKMLQAQINPHFLYNTLETMRMHAEQNDDPDVAEMACSLGKLLRYSLSKSENETSLLSEIEHVEHYTAIHKVRMGSRLEVVWDISEDVVSRLGTFRCPRFIVQPMVENSIQHGISKKRRKGIITISVQDTSDEVVLTIADNGAGISPERLEIITHVLDGTLASEDIPFTGGIGLYNVNERIKAFYGNQFGISMTSVDGEGAQCIIRLGKQM